MVYPRYLDERKAEEGKTDENSSRKRKLSDVSNQSDGLTVEMEVARKKSKSFDIFSRFSSIANMATTAMSNAFGWIFGPKPVRGKELPIAGHVIPDTALILSTDKTIVKVEDVHCSASSSSSSHSQSTELALSKTKLKLEKSTKLSRKNAAAEIQMRVSSIFKQTNSSVDVEDPAPPPPPLYYCRES